MSGVEVDEETAGQYEGGEEWEAEAEAGRVGEAPPWVATTGDVSVLGYLDTESESQTWVIPLMPAKDRRPIQIPRALGYRC